jgi:hypothetical protein
MTTSTTYKPFTELNPGNIHVESQVIHALNHVALSLDRIEKHLDRIASATKQLAHLEGQRLSSGGK